MVRLAAVAGRSWVAADSSADTSEPAAVGAAGLWVVRERVVAAAYSMRPVIGEEAEA